MHFDGESGDDMGLSLLMIHLARDLVRKILFHSDGESGRAGKDGLISSSCVVTTVDNLDGRRGNRLVESPVILRRRKYTSEEISAMA